MKTTGSIAKVKPVTKKAAAWVIKGNKSSAKAQPVSTATRRIVGKLMRNKDVQSVLIQLENK